MDVELKSRDCDYDSDEIVAFITWTLSGLSQSCTINTIREANRRCAVCADHDVKRLHAPFGVSNTIAKPRTPRILRA